MNNSGGKPSILTGLLCLLLLTAQSPACIKPATGAIGPTARALVTAESSITDNTNVPASAVLTIGSTYNLNGSPGKGSVNFFNVDPANETYYIGPGSNKAAVTLKISSAATWDLSVQANGDFVSTTGKKIPVQNLKWAIHNSGIWLPFQLATQPVLTNQAPTPNQFIKFDYSLDISWLIPAGSYATSVTYIVSPRL